MVTREESTICIELETPINDDRPVFLAGGFCDWYPDTASFQMKRQTETSYIYHFPKKWLKEEKLEYKYTKGGWEHVELDLLGNPSANRKINAKQQTVTDFVPNWRSHGQTPFLKKFLPISELLAEDFYIPQLNKTRKIHVLLPYNYYENPTKRYPVLYMQDAQNLFGEGSSYGNWEIDKRLSLLAASGKGEVIVVAIEHGNEDRFTEYSPYKSTLKGKGQGTKYANFIVRTLKPFVDMAYRTRPERAFTGVGGSSMGGLVSIYAGLMYPETIGRLLVFSPSLWVSSKIYFDAMEFFHPQETKMYLYAGGKESDYMLPNLQKLRETIENQGFDAKKLDIHTSIDLAGEHQEKRWGQEFPKAISYLFGS